ncbi:poly-gamma-glutamate hydrolase family protein [uncultured Pseudosulfitobacter sp.]|uniref:poly-gamma-glutamate hydrolase family protein n=1 Tax=uncultured Pseudosulfitobacter sp. TaxID=2854214 RepID=UPI0030D6EBE1|tara:strand:+ start:607 stop:1191 length:585 start_codon:yes stop_codon:yes gene_type:complete
MADRYDTFEDLAADLQEGVDYRIRSSDRGTSVVLLAPHGGTIEPETAEIAEAIAGSDLSFYAFEALKSGAHGDFHITSHRFDEPGAVGLVGKADTSVAIHGRKDGDDDAVWLGGRATALRDAIGAALREAGFDATPNKRLPGVHKMNICNRTRSGAGVQLELSRSLRRRLAGNPALLDAFSTAVRTAIRTPPGN